MNNLPQVGDTVTVRTLDYEGPALITHIHQKDLFKHHMFPIQVILPEDQIHQFVEHNHDQRMYRCSLKEVSMNGEWVDIEPLKPPEIKPTQKKSVKKPKPKEQPTIEEQLSLF